MAALPVALGDGVGAERRGRGVGLRQGALPVGARHAAALAQVRLLLEAPQAGRPSPLQGEHAPRVNEKLSRLTLCGSVFAAGRRVFIVCKSMI